MKIKFNPFNDSGITTYEQFKLYPFLIFGTLEILKNRVEQQLNQIKEGFYFAERLIILGERGIGKTSTLFFIKDLLEEEKIKVILFSRLMEDAEHFYILSKESISIISKKPLYVLIDFPDTFELKSFKRFLNFLWSLMTHKNYNKINLIFAMNKSHYEKSFSFSEIFGKFLTIRLERLDEKETYELIQSRLKLIDLKVDDLFNEEVRNLIFTYSKGIPRNIICACSLLVDSLNSKKITKSTAENILKDKYIDQVINDRVEDLELKRIYKQMIDILEKDFNGTANSQEDYVKKVMEITKIGRNSVLARISDLVRFGIVSQYRGGYNRVNKIISLN